MKSILYTVIFCMVFGCVAVFSASSEGERLYAVGDGFRVTFDDVEALKKRMMEEREIKGPEGNVQGTVVFTSSDEEHRRAALKIMLFAMEAGKNAEMQKIDSSIEKMMELSLLHMEKVLKDYPVSDDIIVSYYRANHHYFRDGKTQTYLPLDDKMKDRIRFRIVSKKKAVISESEFERLKEKYHVRMCSGTGECDK